VNVTFFVKKKDGTRGATLGTVSKYFAGKKRFTTQKRVTRKKAKKLRRVKFGYRVTTSPAGTKMEQCLQQPEPQPE
jgi:hypothetical protein